MPRELASQGRRRVRIGFNVGGAEWPRAELSGITDPAKLRAAATQVGYDEARLVHRAGGTLLRVVIDAGHQLGRDVQELFCADKHHGGKLPVYAHSIEARMKRLDATDAMLDRLAVQVPAGRTHTGAPFDLTRLDAYVAGIEQFDAEKATGGGAVALIVALVVRPPRWIIEAPSDATLAHFRKPYTFGSLWERYVRVYEAYMRYLVQRYVTQSEALRGQTLPPRIAAFEIVNEPDYEWIPDEFRIEKALAPAANPVGKYVTELHLSQIPDREAHNPAAEVAPWGFSVQDGAWGVAGEAVGILDFAWGAKFDWYVKCLAEFHERVSRATRAELAGSPHGGAVTLISGAVTHVNLHYLIAMYRARPTVFDAVEGIGIHPYHWPRHDVLDTQYVSAEPSDGWQAATPREFANRYCKRFDFLEQIAKLTRETDPQRSFGMGGKQLWITEFGLATKKLGVHNTPIKRFVKFIRTREEAPLDDVVSGVWEDLWDAFLGQVDVAYLERNNVAAFCFYALREIGVRGFDLHDDDRSNLAIFHHDGTPRMAAETYERLTAFIRSVGGG